MKIMPKIRIYKTQMGLTAFGKYLTITEFKKLKELIEKYLSYDNKTK